MKCDLNPQAKKMMDATGLPRVFALAQQETDPAGLELTMYDLIGSDTCNAAAFADALKQANGQPLTIRLSSGGGSVFEGWAMAASLKKYPGDTTIIVDGVCASIATVIALAADKTYTNDTSLWMVHEAWSGAIGNKHDFTDLADTLDKIDGNLAQIYAKHAGGTPEKWAELMKAETWFTADSAVQAGLCLPSDDAAPQAKARSIKPVVRASLYDKVKEVAAREGEPLTDLASLRAELDAAMAILQPAPEMAAADRARQRCEQATAEAPLLADALLARRQRRHLARLKAL